jgi:hypothetical protein
MYQFIINSSKIINNSSSKIKLVLLATISVTTAYRIYQFTTDIIHINNNSDSKTHAFLVHAVTVVNIADYSHPFLVAVLIVDGLLVAAVIVVYCESCCPCCWLWLL